MKNQKAQMSIGVLSTVAVVFVIAALVLTIGSSILGEMKDQTYADTATKQLNRSEDITATNATYVRLTKIQSPDRMISGQIVVYNQSTGTTIVNNIAGGNWTVNYDKMQVRPEVDVPASFGYTTGDTWTVAYNVTVAGLSTNVSISGQEAADKLGSWLPTIGLIIASAIIIGIVVGSLAGRKQ